MCLRSSAVKFCPDNTVECLITQICSKHRNPVIENNKHNLVFGAGCCQMSKLLIWKC